ncbi:MAG TPA: NAD(P)-binding protein [Roseiarcus sp.]
MNASLDPIRTPERSVAVIGAGPAGLVAARYLKKHGFQPVVFETAAAVGGQWNPTSPAPFGQAWAPIRAGF